MPKQLSRLASRICEVLLNKPEDVEVVCESTLKPFVSKINSQEAIALAAHASGSVYRAYNHAYVLCHSAVKGYYVVIVDLNTKKCVGKVTSKSRQKHETAD